MPTPISSSISPPTSIITQKPHLLVIFCQNKKELKGKKRELKDNLSNQTFIKINQTTNIKNLKLKTKWRTWNHSIIIIPSPLLVHFIQPCKRDRRVNPSPPLFFNLPLLLGFAGFLKLLLMFFYHFSLISLLKKERKMTNVVAEHLRFPS